jgi:hypothetical protein
MHDSSIKQSYIISVGGYFLQYKADSRELQVIVSTGATPTDIYAAFGCLYTARHLWAPSQYIRVGINTPVWTVSIDWCFRVSFGMLDLYLRALAIDHIHIHDQKDMATMATSASSSQSSPSPLIWPVPKLGGASVKWECTADQAKFSAVKVMRWLLALSWPAAEYKIMFRWPAAAMTDGQVITTFAVIPRPNNNANNAIQPERKLGDEHIRLTTAVAQALARPASAPIATSTVSSRTAVEAPATTTTTSSSASSSHTHTHVNSKRCSTKECDKKAIKVCTRCRQIWYCSSDCQKAHWPVHKPLCVPVPAVPASLVATPGQPSAPASVNL